MRTTLWVSTPLMRADTQPCSSDLTTSCVVLFGIKLSLLLGSQDILISSLAALLGWTLSNKQSTYKCLFCRCCKGWEPTTTPTLQSNHQKWFPSVLTPTFNVWRPRRDNLYAIRDENLNYTFFCCVESLQTLFFFQWIYSSDADIQVVFFDMYSIPAMSQSNKLYVNCNN